jgi:membrane associated rhomboid family serine protease
MIGAMLCWIIMNWSSLGSSPGKIFTLIWLIMLLIFNLILGFVTPTQSSDHIDNWGHFGGTITGFCLAPLVLQFLAQESDKQKKIWRLACGGTLGVYVILGFSLFYTEVHTEDYNY